MSENMAYQSFKSGAYEMENTAIIARDTHHQDIRPADSSTAHDSQVRDRWLHGRSPHTQPAYRHDIDELLSFTGKSIQSTTLADLQVFADSLDLANTSKARALNAVKSLFTFAHRMGYIPMNVGVALRLPKSKNTLAQRILSEEETIRMISLEQNARNHALLKLMYHCGLRVSEAVSLRWRDVTERPSSPSLAKVGKQERSLSRPRCTMNYAHSRRMPVLMTSYSVRAKAARGERRARWSAL
jgi:integrase/recombinase XerD